MNPLGLDSNISLAAGSPYHEVLKCATKENIRNIGASTAEELLTFKFRWNEGGKFVQACLSPKKPSGEQFFRYLTYVEKIFT